MAVLCCLPNLVVLHLERNQVTTLPERIVDVPNLKRLLLTDNLIDSLPGELGELRHLQHLMVAHNQIEAIPWEVTTLPHLNTLNLFHNRIRTLPYRLDGLQSLVLLELGFNALRWLPKSVGELTQLQVLSLFGNQLTQLPEEINHLGRLHVLNAADNAIVSVHLDLDALREVSLYINPLQRISGKTLERLRALPAGERFYLYLYLDSGQRQTLGKDVADMACLKVLDIEKWETDFTKEIPVELQAKYGIKDGRYERLRQHRKKGLSPASRREQHRGH